MKFSGKIIVQEFAETTKAQTEHIGHHRRLEIAAKIMLPIREIFSECSQQKTGEKIGSGEVAL